MGIFLFFLLFFIHPQGAIYVGDTLFISDVGEPENPEDGKIYRVYENIIETYAEGLNDPKGLAYREGTLYVADVDRIWEIRRGEKPIIYAGPLDFPESPQSLNDVVVDSAGNLYISDTDCNAIYFITTEGEIVKFLSIKRPKGLCIQGNELFIIKSTKPGKVYRFKEKILEFIFVSQNIDDGTGIVIDGNTIIVSGFRSGNIVLFDLKTRKEEILAKELDTPSHIGYNKERKVLAIPLFNTGELYFLEIDTLSIR